ncbi:phosphoglycerate dehydrogenase [Tropicimonas sp.]|uniref:phosphoglycerate dehydrogenase n=1 Tax=Tropicimonas sp. TaxID=2067044 RepID=UPI003A886A6B
MTLVATTSPGFARHGSVPGRLERTGWDFVRCADSALSDGGLGNYLAEVDYLVAGLFPVTGETLTAAPRLKGVLKHGVGVDSIDISACTAAGIPVMNTPGANANAVAELAVGMMLSFARNIATGHASVTSGGWNRAAGTEIAGKTLGIVGLGAIGKLLAVKAQALGMEVVASDLYPDHAFMAENGIALEDLGSLLGRADFVSLHVFGGKDNAALIGKPQLERMKPGACLLNLARGEVVDTDALAEALNDGRIAGAAIDAYVSEPPDTSHPIFSAPRVTFTPHTGADTIESIERVGLMNIEDIETLIAGGRPVRCLNPEVFDR